MLSIAQRAAYRVLLDRALRNELITEEEAEGVLSPELFAQFAALYVGHYNRIIDRYDDRVAELYPVIPAEIDDYRAKLENAKKQFDEAPAKIVALYGRIKGKHALARRVQFEDQCAIVANMRYSSRMAFHKLSDHAKAWAVPETAVNGWPPMLADEPPMTLVLPDVEQPGAFAIRHVLTPLLED